MYGSGMNLVVALIDHTCCLACPALASYPRSARAVIGSSNANNLLGRVKESGAGRCGVGCRWPDRDAPHLAKFDGWEARQQGRRSAVATGEETMAPAVERLGNPIYTFLPRHQAVMQQRFKFSVVAAAVNILRNICIFTYAHTCALRQTDLLVFCWYETKGMKIR